MEEEPVKERVASLRTRLLAEFGIIFDLGEFISYQPSLRSKKKPPTHQFLPILGHVLKNSAFADGVANACVISAQFLSDLGSSEFRHLILVITKGFFGSVWCRVLLSKVNGSSEFKFFVDFVMSTTPRDRIQQCPFFGPTTGAVGYNPIGSMAHVPLPCDIPRQT